MGNRIQRLRGLTFSAFLQFHLRHFLLQERGRFHARMKWVRNAFWMIWIFRIILCSMFQKLMGCNLTFCQGFFRKATRDLRRFSSNIQNSYRGLECLDPELTKIYLSSCHSHPTFDWKSFTSCRLEAINPTKSGRDSHRPCWIWA